MEAKRAEEGSPWHVVWRALGLCQNEVKKGEVEARTQGVRDTVHLACRDNGVVIKQGSRAQKV